MLRITPINDEAVKGSWTNYRGVDLQVARANNPEFDKLFSNLTRPYKYQMEKGILDDKTMESILCEAVGTCIVVGWKNFKVDDKEVKYSKANSISLMTNDPDCRRFVQEYSSEVENFVRESEEEIKGK